jgi:N-methylhydantoinase A/oxoprolinase/acetone carboxylase beta subunit
MSWMIGVDVGGTFTDFFAFDDATNRISSIRLR